MPVYDPRIKIQLQKLLEVQWADNTKARLINEAQEAFRDYVASLVEVTD
jgi:polyphosphate kinase